MISLFLIYRQDRFQPLYDAMTRTAVPCAAGLLFSGDCRWNACDG
ncbi:MAG: hypothetical protein OXH76_16420 [Boseongicola sp.]|nr:hypothetical protein [Boseongicola sp.]